MKLKLYSAISKFSEEQVLKRISRINEFGYLMPSESIFYITGTIIMKSSEEAVRIADGLKDIKGDASLYIRSDVILSIGDICVFNNDQFDIIEIIDRTDQSDYKKAIMRKHA